jgi:hypothetical protein
LLASFRNLCKLGGVTMKTVEPWKRWTFVGTLLVVAYFISSRAGRQHAVETQIQEQVAVAKKEKADAQKAAQDLAAANEKYLRRYVNDGFPRKPGRKTIALAATSQGGNLNQTLNAALVRRFSNEGAEVYSTFFTPEFVSDGLFTALFGGSTEVINKLKLKDSLDGVLLIRQRVQFTTNPALENVITANVQLEVMSMPIRAVNQNQTWMFVANGAGFHKADASLLAAERLIKQIEADTKMSLSQISYNQTR